MIMKPIPGCTGGLTGLTDDFAGGIAISNSNTLSNVGVMIDGTTLALNSNLDDVSQSPLIRERLLAQGVFDPHSQHLTYFQTNQPVAISPTSAVTISFAITAIAGRTVVRDRVGLGATAGHLLKPGITGDEFFAIAQDVVVSTASEVPAFSRSALSILAIVMATFGYLLCGRRQS